jgi:hypothetical protein
MLGERLGSKKAGLITNLPSNILVSLIFMALTSGPGYAAESTKGVPIGMMIDTLFVLVFMLAAPLGIAKALALALAAWALVAYCFVAVLPQFGYVGSIVLYLAVAAGCFAIAEWGLKIRAIEKKPVRFSWKHVVIRALFAGTVVAGAVTAAQFAPPYMTGIFATFPAVLSSTLVILTLSQGAAFARATGKMLILSSSNIIVYAAVAGTSFGALGPWLGTLCAFAAALIYIALLSKLTAKIK